MSLRATKAVWASTSQSGSALVVMLALADFADERMVAWPSVPTLARCCRTGERNVRKILDALVTAGEIEEAGTGPRGVVKYRLTPERQDRGRDAQPLNARTGVEGHSNAENDTLTPEPQFTPELEDTPVQEFTPPLSHSSGVPLSYSSPNPSSTHHGTVKDDGGVTREPGSNPSLHPDAKTVVKRYHDLRTQRWPTDNRLFPELTLLAQATGYLAILPLATVLEVLEHETARVASSPDMHPPRSLKAYCHAMERAARQSRTTTTTGGSHAPASRPGAQRRHAYDPDEARRRTAEGYALAMERDERGG